MSHGESRTKLGPRTALLRVIGPGLLVAATGVGAGDLATGALTGSMLGTAVLWAVLLGAGLKFVLNEGLARWQLVTGETLLEGVLRRVPRPARYLFLLYFLPWSWFVGSALISACGVTTHALLPIFDSPVRGKIVFGVLHSLLGLALVSRGGFRAFERLMGLSIGVLFATSLVTVVALGPDWGAIARGLVVPVIPSGDGNGLRWTVGLMGGVGGTLTILCYGYWIREEGRNDVAALRTCRIDLAVGYGATALFGLAMVVIGSTISVTGQGTGLVVDLANRLEAELGAGARLLFLVGAWSAVFSSLLGVWQSVPYLFADFWRLAGASATATTESAPERAAPPTVRSRSYRVYLFALALVPILGLQFGFKGIQLAYTIIGACFMPMLAVALLILNGSSRRVGAWSNRPLTVAILVATVLLFAYAGWSEVTG